ncbi:pyrBI operon leader peptide [Pseudocitrobacter vendiensis]|uniref:pyrBI operon leader peptide n=1 Tax=Pseudocitrobacter vendiensis TaxID=2488306 RepID=UPI003F53026A
MCTTSRLTASENRRWPAVFFPLLTHSRSPLFKGLFFCAGVRRKTWLIRCIKNISFPSTT